MIKNTLSIFILSLIMALPLQAQKSACLNDTINLGTISYRGEHFWQHSVNGSDWSRIDDYQGDTLTIFAKESQFYRYEVLEGSCLPVYSDVLEVIVHQPPVVTLSKIDSVCLDEPGILLSTGNPSGGQYQGDGIIDGKFVASAAGTGTHFYSYLYTDPSTSCGDTASSSIEVLPLTSIAQAGDDILEIIQDSVQLNANVITTGKGSWSVVNGIGGYFSDTTKADAWFHKGPEDVEYKLLWTISSYCGTNSDEIDLLFLRLSSNPCPGTPVVFDADGHMYPTIQIGDQCWMGENLKVGTFVTSIETSSEHSDVSDNGVIEKYYFDNNEANGDLYGGLYDWDEMMNYSTESGSRGICPEGWHIPSNQDWDDLDDNYKYHDPGLHLKEGGDSGFEGKLAGDRHNKGFFASMGSSGFFWASDSYTYNGANHGYVRKLCACNNLLDKIHFSKKTGTSVRCIKDNE
ncbi:MAG: fibrobacter succinogenes major paralogous domain-containing protein [Bacteroidales bacterium]|nr:fibrobacter succinogenes major paralogous domain-containing protein [Bacteroidales bacterium]